MANIQKRGKSYRFTAYSGYDVNGKQIRHTKTWTPPPKMTPKQIEKAVRREAVLFDEQVQNGLYFDGNITLKEFSEKWFTDYAEKQLKEKSLTGYRDIMPRILQALGHMKLSKIQPHHLQEFYNNLTESGVRLDTKYKAKNGIKEIVTAAGYTQSTLSEAANVGVSTIRACYEGKNVSKKTADKISAVLNNKALFEPQEAEKRLSDNTIAKYHRLLSSMLTTAVQWQIIFSNPCRRVKPPRTERKEAAALDEKQVEQLIKCLDNEPLKYKAAIMLILYTGMRRGELCGLNWSDIDLKDGIVHIQRELLYTPSKGIYEDTTKTKQSNRVIQIPDDMIRLLTEYRREQLTRRLELGSKWIETDKVFTSDCGGYIRPDTLTSWFQKFIKRNNLPAETHLHSLRHTSATLLIAGGVDIATVSKRLGHADKSTTLNVYTHAIQSADARAAEKLQDILNPMKRYNKTEAAS